MRVENQRIQRQNRQDELLLWLWMLCCVFIQEIFFPNL